MLALHLLFQLCIMMNNTAHVLQFLDYVPTACNFDKVLQAMTDYDGSSESDLLKSENTLQNIITCAKDDMVNKLDQIILHVGDRVISLISCVSQQCNQSMLYTCMIYEWSVEFLTITQELSHSFRWKRVWKITQWKQSQTIQKILTKYVAKLCFTHAFLTLYIQINIYLFDV